MRRLIPVLVVFVLGPLMAGCGVAGAVATGVKSAQRGLGWGNDPPPAAQPAPPPQPARTATEPPPPQPVARDAVKVEELR